MMNGDMTLAERIESIKAGVVASLAVAIVFCGASLINRLILATRFEPLAGLQVSAAGVSFWVSGVIAAIAGVLFGITYRYVVRQDQNSHLRSGAVLAFGLVRGSAQIDVGVMTQGSLLPFVVLALESVLLFAVARVVLDRAMMDGWVRPFKS